MYGDLGGIGPFWSIVAVIGRGDGQNATLRRLETRILSLKVPENTGLYKCGYLIALASEAINNRVCY